MGKHVRLSNPLYRLKPKSPTNDLPSKPTFCPSFYILLSGTIHSHPNLKPNMAGTNDPSLPSTAPHATRCQVPTSCMIKNELAFIFLTGMASSSITLIIKGQEK